MRYIDEFVHSYAEGGTLRLHMPGHKGSEFTGCEPYDITEISGADYLYEAEGIIGQSEKQMSKAYGSGITLYSAEGSSQCIKTMLGLVRAYRGELRVLAGRNCHKAFLDGCALLGAEVSWLYPEQASPSLCSSFITASDVEKCLKMSDFDCVYITSPDYLGFMCDISGIAEVCKRAGVLLCVDNAHGAYLKFVQRDMHPMSLGADMCCDSAHKTLPCLTGTAMLHLSEGCPDGLRREANRIMSVFGSTSPSYILLRSLDLASDALACTDLPKRIRTACERTAECRERLSKVGFTLVGDEPMKLTVDALQSGLTGNELADRLRKAGIEPEYSDIRYTVLMPSSETRPEDFERVVRAFSEIGAGEPELTDMPGLLPCERAMSIREAMFSPVELVDTVQAVGRICARTITGCQPAVPIAVCGEVINESTARLMEYYSIKTVYVTVKGE